MYTPGLLKAWTRNAFEQSAIGRALSQCSVLYSPDFSSVSDVFYDASGAGSPYFEHMVLPKADEPVGSYYAIGGCRNDERIDIDLFLGPSVLSLMDRNRYVPYGTDKDYIQLYFNISAVEPDKVECVRMIKFDTEAASVTEAGQSADDFFARADKLVADMNAGRLVDFMRMKRQVLERQALGLQENAAMAFMAFERAGLLPQDIYGDRIEQRCAVSGHGRNTVYNQTQKPVLKRDGIYLS
jgi:hypothetical protein